MRKTEIVKIKPKKLTKAIEKIVSNFEVKGVVLLKPNFNTADDFPASTDHRFLEVVVSVLENRGAEKIFIGDSSTFYKSSESVIRKKDLAALKSKDIVEVVNFDRLKRVKKKIPNSKYLKGASIPKLIDEVDSVIYLPCIKTHFHAEYTGSLKLTVGFLPSLEKVGFHFRNLQEKIVEINKLITPDLVIMDARKCFVTGGPVSGRIEEPNIILASEDRVAIDLEGVKIIQNYTGNSLEDKIPEKITQIKFGAQEGLGSLNYKVTDLN